VLVGVEREFQLDPARGPIDFRRLIHTLEIDGARLDPGDVHAYRLRSGAVLTADGVTAEVATPPVPVTSDFANALIGLQQAGLEELTRVLPEGIPVFGYSTHISISVPDDLNDELCALYARTFGPALMFQMNSIRTEGIFIRPRPGRIEFCGNYLSDDRLRTATAFAAASVEACLAHLGGSDSALAALPHDLDVVIGSDPIRYGLQLSAASFAPGTTARDQDLLLTSGSGRITLGELLQNSWQAIQPFLPGPRGAAEGHGTRDRATSPSDPSMPRGPGTTAVSTRPARTDLEQSAVAVFGAILNPVVRPRFSVSAVVAVWDFTIFEVSSERRIGYVAVPRTLLPAFWSELAGGERDAAIEGFLDAEERGRILETNDQTRESGLWDDLVISQRLLSPERYPSESAPQAIAVSSVPGATTERGASSAGATGTASAAGDQPVAAEAAARPGKQPGGLDLRDPADLGDERPGKPPVGDPGRLGKIPFDPPALISLPAPFGGRLLIGLLTALLVALVVVVLLLITSGGGTAGDEPQSTPAASSTSRPSSTPTAAVSAAVPVVGPIKAVLLPPTTTYSVEASSPDGLTLTYRWTLVADRGEDCGTITPRDAATATAGRSFVQWSHANESPDDCDHEADDHPFNIEVEVSDGVNPAVTRSYRGSNNGTGTTTE